MNRANVSIQFCCFEVSQQKLKPNLHIQLRIKMNIHFHILGLQAHMKQRRYVSADRRDATCSKELSSLRKANSILTGNVRGGKRGKIRNSYGCKDTETLKAQGGQLTSIYPSSQTFKCMIITDPLTQPYGCHMSSMQYHQLRDSGFNAGYSVSIHITLIE